MFHRARSSTRITLPVSCPILSLPPLQRGIWQKLCWDWGWWVVSVSTRCINSKFLHASGFTRTSSPKGRLKTWQTWGLWLGNSDLLVCLLFGREQGYYNWSPLLSTGWINMSLWFSITGKFIAQICQVLSIPSLLSINSHSPSDHSYALYGDGGVCPPLSL